MVTAYDPQRFAMPISSTWAYYSARFYGDLAARQEPYLNVPTGAGARDNVQPTPLPRHREESNQPTPLPRNREEPIQPTPKPRSRKWFTPAQNVDELQRKTNAKMYDQTGGAYTDWSDLE